MTYVWFLEKERVEKQDICHRECNLPSHIVVLSAQRKDKIIDDVCSKKMIGFMDSSGLSHSVFPISIKDAAC